MGDESKRSETPVEVDQTFETMAMNSPDSMSSPGGASAQSPTKASDSTSLPFNPMFPAAGMVLGQYRLVDKLGEGGMGTVWKARHLRLDKLVALKLLSSRAQTGIASERFEREMRALGRIEHHNLVRAYDGGDVDGTKYLVMEFIEGTDLSRLVREQGPVELRTALRYIEQAARGLAAAHSAGLVHRDIKPANLLLDGRGEIKVTDLGLARLVDDGEAEADDETEPLTAAGSILGTPDYMAPEQWESTSTVDGRCDLYALGCTLFFLLTGRAPYRDQKSAIDKMKAHVLLPPPDLSAVRSAELSGVRHGIAGPVADLPDEVLAIYNRLVQKSPDDRFANADALVTALQPWLSAPAPAPAPVASVPAPATSAPASANAPGGGWRLWAGGAAAAALVLFGVIVVITKPDGTKVEIPVEPGSRVEIVTKAAPPPVTVPTKPTPPASGNTPAPTVAKTPAPAPANTTPEPLSAANLQRRVAESVLAAGGFVGIHDSQGQWLEVKPGSPLPDQPFLVSQVFLFPRKEWTDAQMPLLGRLPWSGMSGLQINSTSIGDEGISHLTRMSVAGVDCANALMTDAGVARLLDNSGLRWINAHFYNTPLSSATMAKAANLPRFRSIHLHGGSDIAPLGVSRSLRSLSLGEERPATGHISLSSLKSVPTLQSYWTKTGMLEAEADALAAIPSLRQVEIPQKVEASAPAIARLRAARPDLLILHPGAKIDPAQLEAYRWVREAKGTITGYTPPADAPERLPEEAFSLGSVHFWERPVPVRSEAIRGLKGVYELRASQFEDLDAFVDNIATLDTLSIVALVAPQLTAKSLQRLCELPQIELLIFDGAAPVLADEDWAPVANCRWLIWFTMNQSAIGDAGLAHLAKCEQLEKLVLTGATKLTGAGLARFASHRWLWELHLTASNIGDEDVEGIAKIQSLRVLNLRETRVTPAGVAKLKVALPHCAIFHNGGLELPEPLPSGRGL